MSESFFPGDSETANLMRGFDWSNTPLGPAESWSLALRMMVRFLLTSRFPLLLWWGPEHITLYNDAYRSVLGDKHPGALGQPVSAYCHEIWSLLHPTNSTFKDKPAVLNENRVFELNRRGVTQEAEFKITYSPVPDASVSSGIGGILATVHEIPGQAVVDRGLVNPSDCAGHNRIYNPEQAEEELLDRNRQLELLAKTSQRLLLGTESESDMLESIFTEISRLIDMEMFYHFRPSEEPRVLRLHLADGITERERNLFATMRFGELLCGRVAEWRQQIIVEELQHSTHPGSEVLKEEGATSYVGFPMVANGELIGTLAFVSSRRTRLREGHLRVIQTICDQIAMALERNRLISELRLSHERLRVGEERLRLALEGANLGSWDVNLQTGQAIWNRRHALIQGYQPDQGPASIRHWQERVHPDDFDRVMAALDQAKAGHGLFAVEHRTVNPENGEERWLSLYGRCYYDEASVPIRFSGVSLDITERKQIEEERERLVAIVQNSPDFIGCSDAEGNPIFVNREGRNLVGLDQDLDIRQTNIPEYFVPEQREFVKTVVLPAVLSQGRWYGELTFRHFKTGAEIPVLYDLFRVDDPATGKPINFATITRDMREQKRQERELEANRRMLSILVERCPFGIYIVDADFRIASVNAGSQDGAFVNVRPLIGRSFEEAMRIIWPEPVAVEVMAKFRHTLDTGQPYFSKDFVNPRADIAQTEGYEWELHRIPLPDGRNGVVCYYYDSTRLRLAEQRLKESDQKKDEFLATLAHELRNPLAPISNGLHILQMPGVDNETIKRTHAMMERQVDQMVRLVDELMEVSRITRGKIELRREMVNVNDVLRNVAETGQPLFEKKRHRLELSLPATPLLLEADPVRLTQIFTNLLNNAAKYTKEGGRIWLTAWHENMNAVISVKDNGLGIPAEMLPKVFDLFTQVDQTNHYVQGGLGIGLTLVRSLVNLHGGSVEALSEGGGKGCEFVVRLPLAVRKPLPRRFFQEDGRLADMSSRRILVVDDNPDAAESLALLLRQMKAEVMTANSGSDALETLKSYGPSVVLLDLGMPGMDGYEVARQIRQLPEKRDVTLIALTGWGQEENRRKTSAAGFDHHLVKPADLTVLKELLAKVK